jgi:hypothetical protein
MTALQLDIGALYIERFFDDAQRTQQLGLHGFEQLQVVVVLGLG